MPERILKKSIILIYFGWMKGDARGKCKGSE